MKGILVILAVAVAAVSCGNQCPKDQTWDLELLLPHEDCDKFYKCTYGEPVPQNCPPGLLYNIALEQCDWQKEVDCGDRNLPEEGDSEDDGSGFDPEPAPEPESEAEDDVEPEQPESESEEAAEPEQPVSESEEAVEPEQPASESEEAAEPEQPVSESEEAVKPEQPASESEEAVEPEQPASESEEAVEPEQPASESEESTEPAQLESESDELDEPGQAENVSEESAEPVQSESEEVIQPESEESTQEPKIEFLENGCPVSPFVHWLVASEEDCNQFYYCVFGEKQLRQCPSSLHFNPVLQVCDYPWDAGCQLEFNKRVPVRPMLTSF